MEMERRDRIRQLALITVREIEEDNFEYNKTFRHLQNFGGGGL